MAKKSVRKVHRSAITGKFITERYARRNPKTTVTETVKVTRKRKK